MMRIQPEDLAAYLPRDRRIALAAGRALPQVTSGSAIFADISGFTALTLLLTQSLGVRRGAEELPHHLDRVYHALIGLVHAHGGSVIGFSGDAITCWLDADDGSRATACAIAMQAAMLEFAQVALPDGSMTALTLKVAVASGPVRRMVVGDPAIQLMDVIAGETLHRLAAAEAAAKSGEVVLDMQTVEKLAGKAHVLEWREVQAGRVAVLGGFTGQVELLGPDAEPIPDGSELRSWLIPAVFERLLAGQGELLTELRPVVALFLGFSGIDYDGDAEASGKLDSLIRRVQAEAHRLEGTLLQLTVGDKGNYVYLAFGAPVSNEDDSRRAVMVAQRLLQLNSEFGYISDLRIGISQGTMRTGAYGGHKRRTYGALGNETNMAARLMGKAASGQILVSEPVRRSAGPGFKWLTLEPVLVKGREAPLPVFEPVGASASSPDTLRTSSNQLPLVGRSDELSLLLDRLELAGRGHGQVVRISGEAGIGKSRLVSALLGSAQDSSLMVLVGEGESFLADSPYHPWRSVFASILKLGFTDEPSAVAARSLESISPEMLPRLPLLAPVLNLVIPDNALVASLGPELRKTSREALLVDLFRYACHQARAEGRVLLLILENLQWFDPLSQDLLAEIVRVVGGLPVLVLLTSRHEQAHTLASPAVLDIRLNPLTRVESLKLLQNKLSGGGSSLQLPDAVIGQALQRADGNPYYLEELINYLVDQDLETTEEADVKWPDSLHSLILSRIDRLTEHQKATLKASSIIGRAFRLEWLAGYYPSLGGPERISVEAAELSRADLIRSDADDALKYLFKQVITRDVTYESIPFSTRSVMHERLARFVENSLVSDTEPMLDTLALHYGLGNDLEKKREYLMRAGVAAQESYANETALRWLQQLLPLITRTEKLDILQRQGQIQVHMGDYPAATASYQQALELARQIIDPHAEALSMRLLGELLEKQGDYTEAVSWLERARAEFESLGAQLELVQVLLALGGNVLWQQGAYEVARERLEEALHLATHLDDARSIARALHGLGNIQLYQGNLELARQLFTDSLTTRKKIGDSLGIANAVNNLGIIAASLQGVSAARELFEESLQIRRTIGDRAGTAVALNNLGFMAAEQGEPQVAFNLYFESLALRREIGDRPGTAVTLNSLGYLQLNRGRTADAARHYRESLHLSFEVGNVREVAAALAGVAAIAARELPAAAVLLASSAEALLAGIGSALEPEVQTLHDTALAAGREVLTATEFAHLTDRAQNLAMADAVATALNHLDSQAGFGAD